MKGLGAALTQEPETRRFRLQSPDGCRGKVHRHQKGLISTIESSNSSLERQALKTLQPPFTIPVRFIESQVKSVKLALLTCRVTIGASNTRKPSKKDSKGPFK